MRLSLRTELRIFAVCVVLVFVIDYGGGGLNNWSPWPINPASPVQSRLLPALLLYALSWAARLLAGLASPKQASQPERPRQSDGPSQSDRRLRIEDQEES